MSGSNRNIKSYLLVLGLRDSSCMILACFAFVSCSVSSPGLLMQSSQDCLVAFPAERHSIESVPGMYLTRPSSAMCCLSFSTAATFHKMAYFDTFIAIGAQEPSQ